jgi:hypothetical protein
MRGQLATEKELDTSPLHEAGVLRHGDVWIFANRAAVDILWKLGIKIDANIKAFSPALILKTLDHARYARGQKWDAEQKRWIKAEV